MAYASDERELSREELQAKLQRLAREISSDLAALESVQSKELLSDFVSQLFLSAADQSRRPVRTARRPPAGQLRPAPPSLAQRPDVPPAGGQRLRHGQGHLLQRRPPPGRGPGPRRLTFGFTRFREPVEI